MRWKIAFLHGVAVAATFLGVGFLFAIAGPVNAEKAGQLSGGFVVPSLIVALVWSFGRQTRRPGVAYPAAALLVIMLGFELLILVQMVRRSRALPPLTEVDKAQPVVRQAAGSTILCQSALGLRIQSDGVTLTPAADLDQKVGASLARTNLAGWVYREAAGDIVILMGARGFDSERSLHNLVAGFMKSTSANKNIAHTNQRIDWQGDHGTVLVGADLSNGSKMAMRCVTSSNGNLGCVQTIGPDPARLEKLRDSLSSSGCH
jgi:hypothetical protein